MNDNKTEYDCYCDANYTEAGLKKCMHQKDRWSFYSMCDSCSNNDICPIVFEQHKLIIKDIDFSWLDEIPGPPSIPNDDEIWSHSPF